MKKKKSLLHILLTGLLMILVSCGTSKEDAAVQKKDIPYVKGETVMVSHKEVLSGEGRWGQTHYIDDTLYYAVYNSEGSHVYTITDNNSPEVKLGPQSMIIGSYVPDTEGNSYFLSMEDTEEGKLYYLSKVNAEGIEEYRKPVPTFEEELFEMGCADVAVSDQGYCVLSGAGTCMVWDLQGEELASLEDYWFPEGELDFYTAGEYGLVNGAEGIYVYHTAGKCVYLQLVDMANLKLCDEIIIELPVIVKEQTVISSEGSTSSIKMYSSYEKGIYISDEEKLYAYNDSTRELTEVISWSDPGISVKRDYIQEIIVDEQGVPTFYGYDRDNDEGTRYYMTIKKTEDFEKKTIEIGYLSYNETIMLNILEKYLIDFNASQSEITVVFKPYDDLTDLHLALVQGKGPDILHLSELDIEEYVEKGILEDLDPYFDASNTLKKEDILPSLLEMMSRDDSTYFLFPYFSIEVMILADKYAVDSSLTTDEFLNLVSQEEEIYLCNRSDQELMSSLISHDMDQYIDWEKKTCNFDDGHFASYLENLRNAKLPEGRNPYTNLTRAEQIHDGKYAALLDNAITSVLDYRDMIEAFEGYAQIAGYPNLEGKEIYPLESVGLMFGINSASNKKDASWEFLEYYIRKIAKEKEFHRDWAMTFSILEDTFEMQLYPEAIREEYTHTNRFTGETKEEYFVIPDEAREQLRDIVDKLVWSTGDFLSGAIGSIIYEETAPFFAGQKSAEEVADIIQGRVSIYMAE